MRHDHHINAELVSISPEILIQAEKLLEYVKRGGNEEDWWRSKDFSREEEAEISRAAHILFDMKDAELEALVDLLVRLFTRMEEIYQAQIPEPGSGVPFDPELSRKIDWCYAKLQEWSEWRRS